MYTKLIQRGVLCLATIMFVAFFATQVQAAFGNTPTGTRLVRGPTFQNNITVKDFRGNNVPIVNYSFTVLRGLPFTISWDAKGEEVDAGGTLTSTGVKCANDWGTNTDASGSDTGILTSGRTFLLTCSGLGAGMVSTRTAKVGVVNLTVSDISFSGLNSTANGSYTVGTYTLSATIKNAGTMPLGIPFKVTYVRAPGPGPGNLNSFNPLAVRTVDAVTAPALSMSVAPFSAISGTGEWWFKVCADTENTIPETDDTDNCKILGPINVVQASN